MSLKTVNIPPFDPNNFTGPMRLLSGPVRMGAVTLDTPYGEFANWLYVGSSGDVSIIKWDGTNQVLADMPVGWHRMGTIGVNASGTNAGDLVWGS